MFLADPGSGQTVCDHLDEVFSSDHISSGGSDTSAQVLHQGSDDDVGSHMARFSVFHQFSVTVVYHDDDIFVYGADLFDQIADLSDRQRRPGGISSGSLDLDEADVILFQSVQDRFRIEGSVLQIDLFIGDTVFLQGLGGISAEPDHLLQGIIGCSGQGDHRISVFQ